MIKKVWQCGHCGKVETDRAIIEQCCDDSTERAYQCNKCGKLYNFEPENCSCYHGGKS